MKKPVDITIYCFYPDDHATWTSSASDAQYPFKDQGIMFTVPPIHDRIIPETATLAGLDNTIVATYNDPPPRVYLVEDYTQPKDANNHWTRRKITVDGNLQTWLSDCIRATANAVGPVEFPPYVIYACMHRDNALDSPPPKRMKYLNPTYIPKSIAGPSHTG